MDTYISENSQKHSQFGNSNANSKFMDLNAFKRNGDLSDIEIPLNSDKERIAKFGNSQKDFMKKNGEKYANAIISEYVEVIFRGNVKTIYNNVHKIPLNVGDFVMVETDTCCDIGMVETLGDKALLKQNKCNCGNDSIQVNPTFKVIRVPDDDEIKIYYRKIKEEDEVVVQTKELIKNFNLDMKITESHWQFDRQKLTIFFTAPMRIDFRELVKELARLYRTRIELRQISSREEAKRLGCSVGCCGRETCCTSFLPGFEHVTLEHAKIQMLSNNVSKLSGNCGRLKCCIKFEYDNYAAAFETIPPVGSIVEAEEGIGKITKVDIFKNIFTIYFDGLQKFMSFDLDTINKYASNGKIFKPKEDRSFADHNLLELEGL